MTHHKQNTAIGQMLEVVIENGLEGLAVAVSILINEAMKVERSRCLGRWVLAKPRRLGCANGYKPRQFNRRVGKPALQFPQVGGDGDFFPSTYDFYRFIKFDGGVKSPISALRRISRSLRRILSTPHAAEICAP